MDLEANRAELEARANLATALLAQSLAETRSIAAERDAIFADRARISGVAESRGAELQALIASTSWRITRPLRWAARRWAAISGRSAR